MNPNDNNEIPLENPADIQGEVNPEIPSEPAEAPKKRRGRPTSAPKIDEQTISGETGQARKSSRASSKKPSYDSESKGKLARQIQGLHLMAAQMTGIHELAIADIESVMLAEGLINVSIEYGLSLSGKTGAMIQLLGAAALVYLPRFAAIKSKVKARREQQPVTVDAV